jgi:hypothetical protein
MPHHTDSHWPHSDPSRVRALCTAVPVGYPSYLGRCASKSRWEPYGCDSLPERAVFDKSDNSPASSARRLVIEATFAL